MLEDMQAKASRFLAKSEKFGLNEHEKRRLKLLIEHETPTDRAAWEEFMIKMVKDRVCIKFLNDHGLRHVIRAARKNIGKRFAKDKDPFDPDMPECYYWTEEQCANWISISGHPELKEAFLINHISGRKLVALDASALSKMGYRYFNDIKKVTSKIRELLEIPRPNMMRALVRLVPMELFLRKRIYNGRNYNKFTFEKFCAKEGFPYNYLLKNSVNASIAGTSKVLVLLAEEADNVPEDEDDDSSGRYSLNEAPSVEFVARNVIIRNKIIQAIIDNLLLQSFLPDNQKKYGSQLYNEIMKLIRRGIQAMGMEADDVDIDSFTPEKVKIIQEIGQSLVQEMVRTETVLRDIQTTRKIIRKDVSSEEYEDMKVVAEMFMEDVLPIAGLLAVGELNLEGMFRGEPNMQAFVTGIVDEATEINKKLVPETEVFINEIIREAKIRIVSLLYPELPMANIRFVASKDQKGRFLDELIENAFYDYDYQQKTEAELNSFISELPALPTPSKILKSNWGPSPLLSSRDSGTELNDSLKLDPKGIPILDRLNSIELDRLIDTHIIYLNKIPTEIHNQDIIAQAKLAKAKRHAKRAEALSHFNSPAKVKERKFPGKTNEQGIFEEFTVEEKFDKDGVPIVSKLNKEELDDIIINGIVKNDDGLVYVTEEIISAARQEKRRREQMELVGNVRYSNYRRNYPGKIDSSGRYEEFTDKEKFEVSSGTIILSRLTTTELERLFEDGILTLGERKVSIEEPRDKGTKRISDEIQVSLESVQFEMHRRQLETLQDKIRWKAYERKYPGKINKDGDFEEFTQMEKLDSNNLPILSALNDHELEYIVMNGSIQTADGTQHYVDEDVALRARYERTHRHHEKEALDIQFDSYRRNYPGKYQFENDAQGNPTSLFIQFQDNEKIDTLGLPILARLNTKELNRIIKTGKFRNTDLSQNQKILHKAKMEKDKRAHDELVVKVEQGMKWVHFPGRVVNDQFQSYRLQEKFYLKGSGDADASSNIESPEGSQEDEIPAGQQGYPILERLNMNELNEILESRMIPVMDPVTFAVYKLHNTEILKQVKIEKAKRESQQEYAQKQLELLQDKFMRQLNQGKNLNKMKVPPGLGLEAAIKIEFTAEEKYDSNGDPIIERMTDAEIVELIQTAAKNATTMRSSIIAEAIAEQQNRIDQQDQLRKWKLHNAQVVKTKSKAVYGSSSKDTLGSVAAGHVLVVGSATGLKKTDSKPQYESIFQRESKRNLQNVEFTPEQQRLETLHQIISLIETNQSRIAANATQSKSTTRMSPDEVGNLALFNGFIVDTDSKVIGTVNPVNGQIQNQKGAVIGSVTPEGRVMVVRDGKNVAIGRLGADIEQKAVGKFRAIPKAIEPHISKYLAKSATKIQEDEEQNKNKGGGIGNERLANWNIFLPLIFGQIVVEEVDDSGKIWLSPVPDSEKETPETAIRLAQQIQVAGGYDPENIILLEDDVVAQLLAGRDKRIQAKAKRQLQKEREQELAIAAHSSPSTTESSNSSTLNPAKPHKRRKTSHHHGLKHPAHATEDKAQLQEELAVQESDSQQNTTDEETDKNPYPFAWKRREKKHVHRTLAKVDFGMVQTLHPTGASMFKGKSTKLPMMTKGDFIPTTVTWGVKQVPLDEDTPHMFKPPSTTSLPKERKFFDPSEYQAKTSTSRDLNSTKLTSTEKIENTAEQGPALAAKPSKSKQKLQFAEDSPLGEAKRLIRGDGQVLGEIQKDGRIFSVESHTYVGRMKKTGVIVDAKGVRMETAGGGGLKLARENGVVVGELDNKGKVKKTTEVDRFLIGRIWADGRIVTMDDTLIGVIAKDGKIMGAGGKEIGTFTKTWELLGADGVPFAYVSSEGKVYRYEVIPEKKVQKSDQKNAGPTNSGTASKTDSHAKLAGSKTQLGGTSSKPRFYASVPRTNIPVRSDEALIASRITEESTNEEILMDMLERRKQIEAQRKDEENLRMYDKDSKHKTSIKKKLTQSAALFSASQQRLNEVDNLDRKKKVGGKWKDGRSQSLIRDAVEQAEFLKEKIAHRKILVENWAHEVGSSLSSVNTEQYFSVDPSLNVEERQRLVRMAADSIVDDIFKLALTRLLLQAEAGNDTATIMAAMEKIRTTGDDYTTAMWNIDTSNHVLAEYFNKPVDTATKPFRGMSEIGTQEGSAKDYPPLGKGRDRGRSSTGTGHHHRHSRRHSRPSGSGTVSYTLSLEDHEHQPNHNIHDGHGNPHHHRHHHHRPSEDDFDFEHEHHHHHRRHHHDHPHLHHHSLEDDDEFEFEDPIDIHHPAHGLGFKHIIKGPDIEKIVYAHTPVRNVSLESVGSAEVGIRVRSTTKSGHHRHHHHHHHHHKHQQNLGGRLPHIAHPGVHAHRLSLQQEREERAEEIHHGKRELETFELPILPQHSRKHDRGRKGEL